MVMTSIVAESVVTVPDTDVERKSKFLNIYTAFLLLAVVAVRLRRIKDEGLPSPRSSPVKRRRYARRTAHGLMRCEINRVFGFLHFYEEFRISHHAPISDTARIPRKYSLRANFVNANLACKDLLIRYIRHSSGWHRHFHSSIWHFPCSTISLFGSERKISLVH